MQIHNHLEPVRLSWPRFQCAHEVIHEWSVHFCWSKNFSSWNMTPLIKIVKRPWQSTRLLFLDNFRWSRSCSSGPQFHSQSCVCFTKRNIRNRKRNSRPNTTRAICFPHDVMQQHVSTTWCMHACLQFKQFWRSCFTFNCQLTNKNHEMLES